MQSGFTSGSTIVVRLMSTGEDVNADRVRQELMNLHATRHRNTAPSNASLEMMTQIHPCFALGSRRALMPGAHAHQDALCIICQHRPQTSGFHHGETSARSVSLCFYARDVHAGSTSSLVRNVLDDFTVNSLVDARSAESLALVWSPRSSDL